jgi:hypothetical protein
VSRIGGRRVNLTTRLAGVGLLAVLCVPTRSAAAVCPLELVDLAMDGYVRHLALDEGQSSLLTFGDDLGALSLNAWDAEPREGQPHLIESLPVPDISVTPSAMGVEEGIVALAWGGPAQGGGRISLFTYTRASAPGVRLRARGTLTVPGRLGFRLRIAYPYVYFLYDGAGATACASENWRLGVADISDINSPTLVGSTDLPEASCTPPRSLTLVHQGGTSQSRDFVLVTQATHGLTVVEVSDPALPAVVQSHAHPNAWDIESAGGTAVISFSGLSTNAKVLDVSSLPAVTTLGSVSTGTVQATYVLQHSGSRFLLVNSTVYMLDASNRMSPSVQTLGAQPAMYFQYPRLWRGYLYYLSSSQLQARFVCGCDGVCGERCAEAADSAAVAHPMLRAAATYGSYLYVATNGGIDVLAYGSDGALSPVGHVSVTGFPYDLAVVAGKLLATGSAVTRVFDLANPASPAEVTSYSLAFGAIAAVGARTYLGNGGQMQVRDLQPGGSLLLRGTVSPGSTHLVASGTWVFGSSGSDLFVYDVSSPANPVAAVSYFSLGVSESISDLALVGSHLLAAHGRSGLSVIDVSSPTNPQIVRRVDVEGRAVDLVVEGQRLLVAGDDRGAFLYDVSAPEAPIEVGWLPSPPRTLLAHLQGDLAFLGSQVETGASEVSSWRIGCSGCARSAAGTTAVGSARDFASSSDGTLAFLSDGRVVDEVVPPRVDGGVNGLVEVVGNILVTTDAESVYAYDLQGVLWPFPPTLGWATGLWSTPPRAMDANADYVVVAVDDSGGQTSSLHIFNQGDLSWFQSLNAVSRAWDVAISGVDTGSRIAIASLGGAEVFSTEASGFYWDSEWTTGLDTVRVGWMGTSLDHRLVTVGQPGAVTLHRRIGATYVTSGQFATVEAASAETYPYPGIIRDLGSFLFVPLERRGVLVIDAADFHDPKLACELDLGSEQGAVLAVEPSSSGFLQQLVAESDGFTEVQRFERRDLLGCLFAPATGSQQGAVDGARQLGDWDFYAVDVPAGVEGLRVELSPQGGDIDLYVAREMLPSSSSFDCRSAASGQQIDVCDLSPVFAGRWFIGVANYDVGPLTYGLVVSLRGGPMAADSFEGGDLTSWRQVVP